MKAGRIQVMAAASGAVLRRALVESIRRDPDYQDQLVDALATGIARYFAKNPPLARNRSV